MKFLRAIRNTLLLIVLWAACMAIYLWAHTKFVLLAIFGFLALFVFFWFLGQILPARKRPAGSPSARRSGKYPS